MYRKSLRHTQAQLSAPIANTIRCCSIPSRSSSVIMSPVGVPARSSSITSTLNNLARPVTASDLAESLNSLQLGNEEGDGFNGMKTPQPEARPFPSKAPILTPKSPFRSPSYRRSHAPTPSLDDAQQVMPLSNLSEEMDQAAQTIQEIRSHIFLLQEQRHSGHQSSVTASEDRTEELAKSTGLNELDQALIQLDVQLEAASRRMQELETRISELVVSDDQDNVGDTSIIDKELQLWQTRRRISSSGSINSLGSFDDMMLPSFAPALNLRALIGKFDDLGAEWTSVQEDSDALKRELLDDKYLDVFRTVSEQAEGMMSSLDKAVTLCRAFVAQFNQDFKNGLIGQAGADTDDGYDLNAKSEELAALTKTFAVKNQHYLPACQQVFHSLEKGTAERQTSNGSVLRRLADLKARWKLLRDSLATTEKDMKRAETLLDRARTGDSARSISAHLPVPTGAISASDTPTRATAMSRSALSPSRIASGPSRLSSSSSVGSNLSGTPPAAVRRVRRISATAESLGMRNEPMSTPPRVSKFVEAPQTMPVDRHRPLGETTFNTDTPQRNQATSHARLGKGAAETGVLGKSQRGSMLGRSTGRVTSAMVGTSTPSQHGPSSYRSSWLGLDSPAQPSHMRIKQGHESTQFSSSAMDGDVSVEYANATPSRPGSAAGQYYRPPSAQGSVGGIKTRKRDSLIPRLSVSSVESGTRPTSAMSQTSTPLRNTGASRLTMQTPEPTIMARAQRLNMYARAPSTGGSGAVRTPAMPSKRMSRPPPTKRNPVLSTGRMTPLSAAALASVPMAEPSASLKRASIPNLRAAALHSGRTTPTMSENGSGTWQSSATRVSSYLYPSGSVTGSSVCATAAAPPMMGAIEQYRPNPNDTLDVEVGTICNALGVSVVRLDAPLPRGVRLEEGPGKDNRTRYELGGKEVTCRLLELHRPAGSAGLRAGTKAKKILVRVNGGWQDLEQWLLTRLGAL